jgi:hypothetical protein
MLGGLGHFFGYGLIFQVIALVHFIRRRPAGFWIWVIFLGGGFGAIIYLIAEALPGLTSMRHSMHGFSRRKRIRLLEAIVQENPSAGNFEELGELLVDERKFARARECFDRALGARSDSIDPFYKRGLCAFELGDFAAALPDLQRVVGHDPKYAWSRAQSLLARVLEKLGRTSEAEAAFHLLLEQSTSSESLCVAAEFFFERQRFAEGREIAARLLARRAAMPAFQRRRDRVWLRGAAAVLRKSRTPSAES